MKFTNLAKKLFSLALCLSLNMGIAKADEFTVGVVPQFDIATLHKIWSPILRTLEEKTGHTFKLTGAPNIPLFEKAFAQGEYDFAYMNPYHYTIANQYTPIVRDHGRQLYGILVVHKDSEITSPDGLEGSTIAFPAPNALGASLMIRAELAERYKVNFTPKFVNTHSSVFLNTALHQTTAGGGVQKTFNQQPEEVKQQLRVLVKTPSVSPHPLTANKRLSPKVISDVQQALLEMGSDINQAAMLANVPFKKIGAATGSDYDQIRNLNLNTYYVAPE